MNVRPLGAACAGAAGVALLHVGGAVWPAAVLGGAGVAAFILLRTVRGVWVAFSLLLAAALAGWAFGIASAYRPPGELWLWCGALEAYGLGTLAAVRAVRDPVRISRRLLGAWLSSTGAIVLGLALLYDTGASTIASALVTAGILYKLGVAPTYAWAPMLIRHPSRRIAAAGIAGSALSCAVLTNVMPLLRDADTAHQTVILLGGITLPWALWKVVHQWDADRRCAATYAVVSVVSGALLLWFLR